MSDPRLEQAIHDSQISHEADGGVPDVCNRWPEHEADAQAIAATPAGASLLADAAVGAAVRMLMASEDNRGDFTIGLLRALYRATDGMTDAKSKAAIAEALDHD